MSESPKSSRRSSITSNSTRSSTSRGTSGTSNNTQSSDISSFSSESRPSSSASRSSDASLYKMFKEANAGQNPIPKKPTTARPVSVATTRVKTAKPSPYSVSNTGQMKAILMKPDPKTKRRLQVTFNKTQDVVQQTISNSRDLVLGWNSPYSKRVPRMKRQPK